MIAPTEVVGASPAVTDIIVVLLVGAAAKSPDVSGRAYCINCRYSSVGRAPDL